MPRGGRDEVRGRVWILGGPTAGGGRVACGFPRGPLLGGVDLHLSGPCFPRPTHPTRAVLRGHIRPRSAHTLAISTITATTTCPADLFR